MRIDPYSNKTAYAMMMLGAIMTCSIVGSLLIGAYCALFWLFPADSMIAFFVWTVAISVVTWRLDAHLYPKEGILP